MILSICGINISEKNLTKGMPEVCPDTALPNLHLTVTEEAYHTVYSFVLEG